MIMYIPIYDAQDILISGLAVVKAVEHHDIPWFGHYVHANPMVTTRMITLVINSFTSKIENEMNLVLQLTRSCRGQ